MRAVPLAFGLLLLLPAAAAGLPSNHHLTAAGETSFGEAIDVPANFLLGIAGTGPCAELVVQGMTTAGPRIDRHPVCVGLHDTDATDTLSIRGPDVDLSGLGVYHCRPSLVTAAGAFALDGTIAGVRALGVAEVWVPICGNG